MGLAYDDNFVSILYECPWLCEIHSMNNLPRSSHEGSSRLTWHKDFRCHVLFSITN
uniref:Uncharacterized protein n=1 Tax=Lepeophtheirus salmonis TaxID=72036 RepID=A0A0K2VI32_LEPSM